ncbi:unnamed protein product [Durusdinium trenchii]|uniref:Uncharacterized protein n=1 Tax=Durusdinium trenchii TaxID=1381693 RepID=A0ABP0N8N1_9DINO
MSVTWSSLTLANCGFAALTSVVKATPSPPKLMRGWEEKGESRLKTEIDLALPWNEGTRPAVEDWLAAEQSKTDRQRLVCLGNIVVPLQAKMAIGIISGIQSKILQG